MITQKEVEKLELRGKLFFLFGIIAIIALLVITLFFHTILSPLRLLQIRLSVVGTGIVYCLLIYFIIHRGLKKLQTQLIGNAKDTEKNNDVIIIFNGKELGKK